MDEAKGGSLPRLVMQSQLKAFGEQRLHHQPHLIFRCAGWSSCFDIKAVCRNPLGHGWREVLQLLVAHLVRKCDVSERRCVRSTESAASRSIDTPGTKRKAGRRFYVRFTWLDRSNIEGHLTARA